MALLGVRELSWHMVACGHPGTVTVTVTVTSCCVEPSVATNTDH